LKFECRRLRLLNITIILYIIMIHGVTNNHKLCVIVLMCRILNCITLHNALCFIRCLHSGYSFNNNNNKTKNKINTATMLTVVIFVLLSLCEIEYKLTYIVSKTLSRRHSILIVVITIIYYYVCSIIRTSRDFNIDDTL